MHGRAEVKKTRTRRKDQQTRWTTQCGRMWKQEGTVGREMVQHVRKGGTSMEENDSEGGKINKEGEKVKVEEGGPYKAD